MTPSEWIVFGVGVAAIVVSILALRENRASRLASFQPHLYFRDSRFGLRVDSRNVPRAIVVGAESDRSDFYVPDYTLELHNIGLGAAHTVKLSWTFDAEPVKARLVRLGDAMQTVTRESDVQFHFRVPPNREHGFGFVLQNSEQFSETWSFIRSGESVRVSLPETIRNAMTFIPYLEVTANGVAHTDVDIELNVIAVLKYCDIAGRILGASQQVIVQTYVAGTPSKTGRFGVGRLRFVPA